MSAPHVAADVYVAPDATGADRVWVRNPDREAFPAPVYDTTLGAVTEAVMRAYGLTHDDPETDRLVGLVWSRLFGHLTEED